MIKSENKPVIILFVFITVFVVSLYIFLSIEIVPVKTFNIILNNNDLNISGKNAMNISVKNIKEVKLLNKAPTIIFNGGGEANNMIFGHNYMKNIGFTQCYVNNYLGDVIFIKSSNNQFLIGLDNNLETKNLYYKLKSIKNI